MFSVGLRCEMTKESLVQVLLSIFLFVYGWTSFTILSICCWGLIFHYRQTLVKGKSGNYGHLFKEKNVWITGASSGIGEALVGISKALWKVRIQLRFAR